MPLFGKRKETPGKEKRQTGPVPPHPEVTRQRHDSDPDIWVYFVTFVNSDYELQEQIGMAGDGWHAEHVPWSMFPPETRSAAFQQHTKTREYLYSMGTVSGGQWSKWELPGEPPPVPGDV